MKKVARIICSPHLWIIIIIFISCAFLHYPEFIPMARQVSILSFFGLERHALVRILFIIPITYASYIFGIRGGIVALSISLAAMLPRVLFISNYPKDALFETVTTVIIGTLIVGWLESRRRELGKREQTILKLETVRRELQRIGKRFQEIFEKANDAIWIQDLSGTIITANAACSHVTGFEPDSLIGKKATELFAPEELKSVKEVERALLNHSNLKQPYEQRIIKRDGTRAVIMLTSSLLGDEKAPAFLHIARDITEEIKLQESLRLYTEQISRAHEEERKRIARELHDDTIQTLVAISRHLDNFISRKSGEKHNVFKPLEEIQKEINESLIRIRHFVQHLRPPILELLGLLPALRELADQMSQQSGLKVNLDAKAYHQKVNTEEGLLIYRIVQEAMRNAWKHSEATEVDITLASNEESMRVSIRDNGKGFKSQGESELLSSGKLGIKGMKERAHLLNGILDIDSKSDRGTIVTLTFPQK